MKTLTISQIAALAVSCPSAALVVEGPPGSAKTFGLTAELEKAGYHVLRIDAQNTQPEFLAQLPLIDQKTGTVSFVGHDVWAPRPKMAIMIDELFKAPKHVVDAFLSLVFGNEFMGHKYNADTIRIVTCNNAEFGLGDKELPHMGNRTCRVQVAPMQLKEATRVMVELGFDSRVLRWAEADPAALISWDEGLARQHGDTEASAYYGFDPRNPRRKFVSMRSLEMASNFMKAGVRGDTLAVALAGAIGEKAAYALIANMAKAKTYATPAQVRAAPATVALPSASYETRELVVALALAGVVTDKAWIPTFFTRLPGEYARLFCHYATHKTWACGAVGVDAGWDKFLRANLG